MYVYVTTVRHISSNTTADSSNTGNSNDRNAIIDKFDKICCIMDDNFNIAMNNDEYEWVNAVSEAIEERDDISGQIRNNFSDKS